MQAVALSSEKLSRAESSRVNGAQSSGPATESGKARSSQNAFKTGIYSKRVVLPNEKMDDFLAHRAAYFQLFQPANPLEADLVEDMVNARWRIQRIERTETCNLTLEMFDAVRNAEWLQSREFPDYENAIAFSGMSSQGNYLNTLARYEARYRRTFDRALKTLQQLRSKAGIPLPTFDVIDLPAEQQNRRNEPENAHPTSKNEGTNPSGPIPVA